MSALSNKFKRTAVFWCCLLALLGLVGKTSAASASSQLQTDILPVPSVYTFEGESLSKVLTLAARTIRTCGCESMASHFVFERPSDPWYRLSIYLHGPFPTPATPSSPEDWERVVFQGDSLPTLLSAVARYVDDCQCQDYVVDMIYRRSGPSADSDAPFPLHNIYLIIAWPFPDK